MASPYGYSARSSRTLEDLKNGTNILSGADSQALRTYCTSEVLIPSRDLDNEYGRLIKNSELAPLQAHFQARVETLANDPSAAAQELYSMKWGPTQLPVFNIILMFMYMDPSTRSSYLEIADWLINTAKVTVDGTDLSGTTALMHSISTKPYLDTQFAELLHAAGGNINHRNRYGGTAAHEFAMVRQFDAESRRRPLEALRWFLAHGGDLNVKDGDGMSAKYIITRLASLVPELKAAMDEANGGGRSPISSKKVGRNDPCLCGSGKKYKICCGKN